MQVSDFDYGKDLLILVSHIAKRQGWSLVTAVVSTRTVVHNSFDAIPMPLNTSSEKEKLDITA